MCDRSRSMLAIVKGDSNGDKSQDDPIPTTVRSSNVVQNWQLVPQNHQIAQRNLHIVTSSAPGAPVSGMEGINVPNPTRERSVQLVLGRSSLPREGSLSVLLPSGATERAKGIKSAT